MKASWKKLAITATLLLGGLVAAPGRANATVFDYSDGGGDTAISASLSVGDHSFTCTVSGQGDFDATYPGIDWPEVHWHLSVAESGGGTGGPDADKWYSPYGDGGSPCNGNSNYVHEDYNFAWTGSSTGLLTAHNYNAECSVTGLDFAGGCPGTFDYVVPVNVQADVTANHTF